MIFHLFIYFCCTTNINYRNETCKNNNPVPIILWVSCGGLFYKSNEGSCPPLHQVLHIKKNKRIVTSLLIAFREYLFKFALIFRGYPIINKEIRLCSGGGGLENNLFYFCTFQRNNVFIFIFSP